MKIKKVRDLFKQTSVKAAGAVLAAAIAIGSIFAANYESTTIPELVTNVDTTEVVIIEDEDVPLTEPQVTTSTKTKKSTKKITMKKAASKTYTSKGSIKIKKSTKTQNTIKAKTTTQTVTSTQVTNSYKKKSKVCTQTTTTKTTVTKTVVVKSTTTTNTSSATATAGASISTGTANLTAAALVPKAGSNVIYAWNTLGFSFKENSSVNYSGMFDAKSRTITLKDASSSNVNYHELGHFVAFVAGNADDTAEFKNIYNAEKDNYTAYNKAYVTKSSSEYFAESYKDYVLTPGELKQSRPQTYAAIEAALAKVTTSQVSRIATVYAAVWS